MRVAALGTIIAIRKLTLDNSRVVTVRFGKPRKMRGASSYYCPFQIRGVRESKVRYAAGIDGVQALELALKMVGALLYTSVEYASGRLTFEGDGDLRFPVDDCIQELIRGAKVDPAQASREQQLQALKAESELGLIDMIRSLLAKPLQERTHFLRKRISYRGSCL